MTSSFQLIFGSVGVLGSAIALTLIREMGPVLAAIMITARAGSAMTAELGIHRISEQIDALPPCASIRWVSWSRRPI
jgi:phospholipid/cholesterol/gamma-HCH transport system permease protein